jgi:hypothetical protein
MVYASADAPHLQPVSLLRPGETYTDHGYMPAKDGVTPSGVTPEVTMLVFEDGMALGEPGALQFVSKFRRSMADKYAAAAVDLRVIAGSSDRAGAAEELLRTLRDATATRPPRGQNYDSYNINSYRLQRLQQVRTWVADQDRLELEIKEQERFEAFARSHSDLTMGVIQ